MTTQQFKKEFECQYECTISKDGIKKIHEYYSRFDEDIIEEAFWCCVEQYDDPTEVFNKLGGVCYNKTVSYLED